MKIALGQLHLYWEDKESNLKKVKNCLEQLKKEQIDLLLLPEMSLTGFSMNTNRTKETDHWTVEQVHKLAGQYGITIGVGWVKDTGELCENHYSLVTVDGEILDYTKIHPFRYGGETQYFQGGEKLSVCEYKGMKIGVQICYDLRFPEPFQNLSKTADLIIVPANWPAARREHWNCLLKARAIENMVYVAGINCAGDMGGQYYSGDSAVYAPDGSICNAKEIALNGCPQEKILLIDFENDIEDYRKRFPMKEDRREQLYRDLAGVETI